MLVTHTQNPQATPKQPKLAPGEFHCSYTGILLNAKFVLNIQDELRCLFLRVTLPQLCMFTCQLWRLGVPMVVTCWRRCESQEIDMASAFPHQASSMMSVYYVFHGNRVAWLSDHGRLAERPVFLSLACATRRCLGVCCDSVMLILRPTILRAIPCCQSWVSELGVISYYKSLQSSSIQRKCTYVTTTQLCNPHGT